MPGWLAPQRRPLYRTVLVLAVLVLVAGFGHPVPALAATVTLKVSGVKGELLANVTAALELPPGVVNNGVVERHWLERHAAKIPELVDRALRPFGYYRSRSQYQVNATNSGSYVVLVEIVAGDPVRVTRRDVLVQGAGAGEKRLTDLVAAFPLRPGDVLDQGAYEAAKSLLKATALDLGYLDATFSRHSLAINPQAGSCEVDLLLETGNRYRFGAVTISGAPDYPADKLQRYLSFKAGEPFSHAELGETQLNFLNTDAFREVLITPRKDLAREDTVPVTVQLTANPRHRLRPGVGYATDSGFRVSLRYDNRNLFNWGHQFRADLDLGETRQSVSATYAIPKPDDLSSQTLLKIGYEREIPETYESRTAFTEVERLKGFGEDRVGSVYLRFQREDYIVASEHEIARLVIPGVRWRVTDYDDPQRPTKGYAYRLEVRGTHQALGSDTSLLQLIGGASAMLPLPGPFAQYFHLDTGTTWQDDPFNEVPASMRFFAGGDNSVRGYGYETLGPVDANGEVIGGRNLLTAGTDFEWAIGEEWGVTAFYDIGNAFDSWVDFELMQGAGIGLRRYTVVGPVRLDLARQINVEDPAWRVHVAIGFSW